jgi:hypothetical protein
MLNFLEIYENFFTNLDTNGGIVLEMSYLEWGTKEI